MKRSELKSMKSMSFTNDCIYDLKVSELGLFGIAFFGHKGTKQEKRKLSNLWKQIINFK